MDSKHTSIKGFTARNDAYTEPSLRNIIFKHGAELEKAGAIFRFGRKVIVNEPRMLEVLPTLRARGTQAA